MTEYHLSTSMRGIIYVEGTTKNMSSLKIGGICIRFKFCCVLNEISDEDKTEDVNFSLFVGLWDTADGGNEFLIKICLSFVNIMFNPCLLLLTILYVDLFSAGDYLC